MHRPIQLTKVARITSKLHIKPVQYSLMKKPEKYGLNADFRGGRAALEKKQLVWLNKLSYLQLPKKRTFVWDLPSLDKHTKCGQIHGVKYKVGCTFPLRPKIPSMYNTEKAVDFECIVSCGRVWGEA